MTDSLKSQAVKGVVWSAVERFSVQGIQFVLSIIIARLVAPSEYGLIAMLGIFLAVAQTFIDSGFGSALIQKKDRTEKDFSTVFYFNIVVSLVVYLALFLFAPFIARFYNEPLLESLTKWISLNIIVSAFSIVQRVKLTILLDFKTQAKASFISVVISGICGVVLAYYGYGVWALLVQALLNSFLNTILLWVFSPWKFSLTFSIGLLGNLFSFSGKILLAELLNTLYTNMYSLVIGKKFSPVDLGYYARSFSFSNFLSINLTGIMQKVFYPMLCEVQNEEERMKIFFLKSLRGAFFLICPCMIGLAALSKPLVLFLLTDKWIVVAYLLPILCFANLFYPLQCISAQAIYAKGYSNYILKAEIIKKTLGFLILVMSLPYGLYILCSGIILCNIFDLVIIQFFLSKSIGISGFDIIKSIFPIMLCGIIMGGIIYSITIIITSSFFSLLVGSIVGAGSYFLGALLFKMKELDFIKNKTLLRSL